MSKTKFFIRFFLIASSALAVMTSVVPAQAGEALRPLAASGDFLWAGSFNSPGYDDIYGLTTDSDGNIYMTGRMDGFAIDFDPGPGVYNLTGETYIVKLNGSGGLVWAKALDGQSGFPAGYKIAVDTNGNVYVLGFFTGNGSADFDPSGGTAILDAESGKTFLLKLDEDGNFIWARQFGGNGMDLAIDTQGNVHLTGYFSNEADLDPGTGAAIFTSAGGDDIFVLKLDGNGNLVWAKSMGGVSEDKSIGIALDREGNVLTTGKFASNADFDPGIDPFFLTAAGLQDIFVSKLNRDGEFVWAKGMGSPGGNDIGNDIAVDSLGNPYITGSFESTADFDPNAGTFYLMSSGAGDIFITRLSALGDLIWAKRIGSSSYDTGYALKLDSSSNVYTTGIFTGIVDFNPNAGTNSLVSANGSIDAFISKLDSNGNYVLAKWMGGEYSDLGWELALDGQANIFIAGWYFGPFSFYPDAGAPVLNSLGNRDGFFVKYEHGEVAPSITSITRAGANPSSGASVDFNVTFSESVSSVDVNDFSVEAVGVTGAAVSAVGGAGNSYTVTVNTGSGNGKIALKIADGATILDSSFIGLDPAGAQRSNFKGNEVYTVIKSAVFADVPLDYWALGFIERLYNEGVTGGCSNAPLSYCPENSVTRAQMAVFLEKAIRIKGFSPANVSATFSDTAGHWAEDWIEALKSDGITSGCAAGLYCPENAVTRAQMAVFLLKSKHGSIYTPPPATGTFGDVSTDYWAAAWIEQLAAEGITSGCAAGLYCPESPVTRAQMAVFLVKAFNLP